MSPEILKAQQILTVPSSYTTTVFVLSLWGACFFINTIVTVEVRCSWQHRIAISPSHHCKRKTDRGRLIWCQSHFLTPSAHKLNTCQRQQSSHLQWFVQWNYKMSQTRPWKKFIQPVKLGESHVMPLQLKIWSKSKWHHEKWFQTQPSMVGIKTFRHIDLQSEVVITSIYPSIKFWIVQYTINIWSA